MKEVESGTARSVPKDGPSCLWEWEVRNKVRVGGQDKRCVKLNVGVGGPYEKIEELVVGRQY